MEYWSLIQSERFNYVCSQSEKYEKSVRSGGCDRQRDELVVFGLELRPWIGLMAGIESVFAV